MTEPEWTELRHRVLRGITDGTVRLNTAPRIGRGHWRIPPALGPVRHTSRCASSLLIEHGLVTLLAADHDGPVLTDAGRDLLSRWDAEHGGPR